MHTESSRISSTGNVALCPALPPTPSLPSYTSQDEAPHHHCHCPPRQESCPCISSVPEEKDVWPRSDRARPLSSWLVFLSALSAENPRFMFSFIPSLLSPTSAFLLAWVGWGYKHTYVYGERHSLVHVELRRLESCCQSRLASTRPYAAKLI